MIDSWLKSDQIPDVDFETLLPNVIFDAVSTQGFQPTGALYPLNSYENRVYEVPLENGEGVIIKFYRPNRWNEAQIDEEHRFTLALNDNEVPVVVPLSLKTALVNRPTLGKTHGYFFALFDKFRGRSEADLSDDNRRWLGRHLARMHNVGEIFPFEHRLQLDVQTYGYDSLEDLFEQAFAPEDLWPNLENLILTALGLIEPFFKELPLIATHGDVHLGNVLWNAKGPWLLDFDDAVLAPGVQDIWMLFSGNEEEQRPQREAFLEGYETFRNFDEAEWRLTEPLRTLRIIRHAAWLGRRYDEPMFKRAFPYYLERRYWEEFLLTIREQISELQELNWR